MKEEMEKFDRELNRQLNERRLTPSADAWERVMLQRQGENRKKKRAFPLFWIAAAVLIGFGIFFLGRESGEADVEQTQVAATPKVEKASVEPVEKQTFDEPVIAETTESPERISSETLSVPLPQTPKTQIEVVQSQTAGPQQRKMDEIVAAVLEMKDAGKQVSEDDIDALIDKARRDLASGNGVSKQTDASALLQDSENQLTNEFRSNVFKELVKHKRIRIAFGDR